METKLFIYAADTADKPYSELSIGKAPSNNGLRLFAVFESPRLGEVLDDILRLARWGRDPDTGKPVDGCPRSARILCTDVCDAFMHLVEVPFVCRRAVDTELAADGSERAFRHGVKSATISYAPSAEPLATESA